MKKGEKPINPDMTMDRWRQHERAEKAIQEWVAYIDGRWWRVAGKTEEAARKNLSDILWNRWGIRVGNVLLRKDDSWLR